MCEPHHRRAGRRQPRPRRRAGGDGAVPARPSRRTRRSRSSSSATAEFHTAVGSLARNKVLQLSLMVDRPDHHPPRRRQRRPRDARDTIEHDHVGDRRRHRRRAPAQGARPDGRPHPGDHRLLPGRARPADGRLHRLALTLAPVDLARPDRLASSDDIRSPWGVGRGLRRANSRCPRPGPVYELAGQRWEHRRLPRGLAPGSGRVLALGHGAAAADDAAPRWARRDRQRVLMTMVERPAGGVRPRGPTMAESRREGRSRSRRCAPARTSTGPAWSPTCASRSPSWTGEFYVLQFPNGSANLTYLVSFGDTQLVVRRPPFGQLAPGRPRHEARVPGRARAVASTSTGRRGRYLFCDDHDVIGSDFLVVEYRTGVVVWDHVPPSMAHHADAGRAHRARRRRRPGRPPPARPDEIGLGDLGRPDRLRRAAGPRVDEALGPRRHRPGPADDASWRRGWPTPCRPPAAARRPSCTTTTRSTTASSTRRTPTG